MVLHNSWPIHRADSTTAEVAAMAGVAIACMLMPHLRTALREPGETTVIVR